MNKKIIVFTLCRGVICFSWIGLEHVIDGVVISQYSDSVFAILLTFCMTDSICNRNMVLNEKSKYNSNTDTEDVLNKGLM